MTYEPDDSEIEASRAPLMDHLIELRTRLIICVAALVVGFAICFAFSSQIYIFLLHPFEVGAGLLAAQKAGISPTEKTSLTWDWPRRCDLADGCTISLAPPSG